MSSLFDVNKNNREHVAVVVGDWVYIDGGEFSFMSHGSPAYEYCMFSGLRVIHLF